MDSEYYEIEEIRQLESAFDSYSRHTGEMLAKRFERLQKRQESEFKQLAGLRRDLNRLPPGPQRQRIAEEISEFVEIHSGKAARLCKRISKEAAQE